jgi:uncharacterized protein (DUF433 family)
MARTVNQVVDGGGVELDYNALADIITQRQVAMGIKSTDPTARIGSETASQANARITAAYKAQPKPDLTVEGAAAGATIEFVRTGAGGVGEYREVFPIGAPIPTTRTTNSGNVYDKQGNLVSGTGVKTSTTSGVSTGTSKAVQSSVKNSDGSTTITYTDGTKTTTQPTIVTPPDPLGGDLSNPAFSIVEGILKNYDMKGVADSIAKIRKDYPEIASDDILALLKFDTRYNAPYLERFAGNAELIKKGLPTLSDESYLKVEKEYENIFKSYDVGSLANRKTYATLIGNSMDAVDVTSRLKIGYDRLKADKNIETAFREFYPSLSDGDIVAAMLNPKEMLPALERKAAAAEIGGSYLAQGLKTDITSAESLASYGVTKAGAQAGVRYIAQALPRGQFLSDISKETGINYTQKTAEDITFKKDVKAQQQEDILKAKEVARFGGEAGTIGSKSLASQQRGAGLI